MRSAFAYRLPLRPPLWLCFMAIAKPPLAARKLCFSSKVSTDVCVSARLDEDDDDLLLLLPFLSSKVVAGSAPVVSALNALVGDRGLVTPAAPAVELLVRGRPSCFWSRTRSRVPRSRMAEAVEAAVPGRLTMEVRRGGSFA